MDKDELIDLFRQYMRSRDTELRDRLVPYYLDQVRFLARKVAREKVSEGSLLQALERIGVVGLTRALEQYETPGQTKFTTYATPVIIGEMRRYLYQQRNGDGNSPTV